MVATRLNGRWDITLPKHRADRPDWYTPTGWEKTRLEALHDVITARHDPIVYYVGAEEGEMPALCQMWGAQVFLFEPNPRVWPNIKAIWDANHLDTPRTFPGFASNTTATLSTPIMWGWPACATGEVIGNHGFKELYQEAQHYPQIRLDDIDPDTPPDVITFDVEGSEWQVLRGAERILRDHRPVLVASIHPEFLYHQWGEYSADFRGWIKGFGYREKILDYQHELHCLYEPA